MKKKGEKCGVCGGETREECKDGRYEYVQCGGCGWVWLVNPPKGEYREKYYSYKDERRSREEVERASPVLGWWLSFPFLKWLAFWWSQWVCKGRADAVNDFARERKVENLSLLDVGCGPGDFLRQMQRRGWEVMGTELGDRLVKLAESKVGEGRVVKAMIEKGGSEQLRGRRFGVVSLWHVWEHVEEYGELLVEMAKLLERDGWLVLETPNANSVNFRIFKENWTHLMAPHHLHLWSAGSLKKLLVAEGFGIEKVEYPLHFPFVFASSWVKKDKRMRWFLPLLLPVAVVVAAISAFWGWGDTIRVYAIRKN